MMCSKSPMSASAPASGWSRWRFGPQAAPGQGGEDEDMLGRAPRAPSADGAACPPIYAPFGPHSAISFETGPPGTAEMADRIAAATACHAWLVGEEDGRV